MHPFFASSRGGVVAMLLTVAVLSAACGSSSAETATPVDVSDTDTTLVPTTTSGSDDSTTETGDDPDSASAASADEPSTLQDYLGTAAGFRGLGGGGPGASGPGSIDPEQITQEQRLIEQEIQRCMQAQGFTYVPEELDGGFQFFLANESSGTSAEDYAATSGFGISTRFDALLDDDADLAVDAASANDEHLATLSDGEADAWQYALRGAPPERNEQGQLIDSETGEVIAGGGRGRSTGGCALDAQVAVRGDFSVLAELEDEFVALDERIEADPRVAEIRREWASCMRDGGFDYEDADEARSDINSQFRPLIRSFFSGENQNADDGPGPGRGGALEVLASQGLTDEQESELDQLQDLEIATAVASLDCAGDTEAEIAEITVGYEAEFVEANRETLERIAN